MSREPRMALATARSSPKFGSVTTIPSISSAWSRNRCAHLAASSSDSTEPYSVSSGPNATTSNPAACRVAIMSRRPCLQSSLGKKPRFPTIRPTVKGPSGTSDWACLLIGVLLAPARGLALGAKDRRPPMPPTGKTSGQRHRALHGAALIGLRCVGQDLCRPNRPWRLGSAGSGTPIGGAGGACLAPLSSATAKGRLWGQKLN